jgi:hypothetical protein
MDRVTVEARIIMHIDALTSSKTNIMTIFGLLD